MNDPGLSRVGVRSNGNLKILWVVLAIIAAGMAIRLIHIDADPVSWNPDTGYYIDEGYKTLSPRNLVQFGTTHWNKQDEYVGWMKLSPATQWPYYLAFRLFGPELSSARLVTLLYFTILLVAAGLFMARRLAPGAIFAGVLLLLADPGLFIYSRSALFEISIATWLYLAIFAVALIPARRDLSAAVILLAVGIAGTIWLKGSTILYIFAPFAACVGLSMSRHLTAKRAAYIGGIGVVTIGIILVLTRRIWVHKLGLGALPTHPQLVLLNPLPAVSPLAVMLGQLVLLDLVLRRPQALFTDRYRLCLAAIVILVPLAYGLFKFHPVRYFVPVLPACLLIAAEWLQLQRAPASSSEATVPRPLVILIAAVIFACLTMTALNAANVFVIPHLPLPQGEDPGISEPVLLWLYLPVLAVAALVYFIALRRRWAQFAPAMIIVLMAAQIATGFATEGVTLANPSWASKAIRDKLASIVEDDQSVGGDWAPFFTAGTGIHSLYMRPDFNSAALVKALHPTYFLYSNTWYDRKTLKGLQEESTDVRLLAPTELGRYQREAILLYPLQYKRGASKGG